MQVLVKQPVELARRMQTPESANTSTRPEVSLPSPPYSVQPQRNSCREEMGNTSSSTSVASTTSTASTGEPPNERDSVVSILQSLRSAPVSHGTPPGPMMSVPMPPRYPMVQQWLHDMVEACVPVEQILKGQVPPDPARLVPTHARLQAIISSISQQGGFLIDVRGHQGHHLGGPVPPYMQMMPLPMPQQPDSIPPFERPGGSQYAVPVGLMGSVPADYYQALNCERAPGTDHVVAAHSSQVPPPTEHSIMQPMVPPPILPALRQVAHLAPQIGGHSHGGATMEVLPSGMPSQVPSQFGPQMGGQMGGQMRPQGGPPVAHQIGDHPVMHVFPGYGNQVPQSAVHHVQPTMRHDHSEKVASPETEYGQNHDFSGEYASDATPSPSMESRSDVLTPTRRQQKRRRATAESGTVQCQQCGTFETPEWRRGPNGARTLCNACGLYHAKVAKKRGEAEAARRLRERRKNRPSSPRSHVEVHTTQMSLEPVSQNANYQSAVLANATPDTKTEAIESAQAKLDPQVGPKPENMEPENTESEKTQMPESKSDEIATDEVSIASEPSAPCTP